MNKFLVSTLLGLCLAFFIAIFAHLWVSWMVILISYVVILGGFDLYGGYQMIKARKGRKSTIGWNNQFSSGYDRFHYHAPQKGARSS